MSFERAVVYGISDWHNTWRHTIIAILYSDKKKIDHARLCVSVTSLPDVTSPTSRNRPLHKTEGTRARGKPQRTQKKPRKRIELQKRVYFESLGRDHKLWSSLSSFCAKWNIFSIEMSGQSFPLLLSNLVATKFNSHPGQPVILQKQNQTKTLQTVLRQAIVIHYYSLLGTCQMARLTSHFIFKHISPPKCKWKNLNVHRRWM